MAMNLNRVQCVRRKAMSDLDNNLVACFNADQDGGNKTFAGYISQQEARDRYFNDEPPKYLVQDCVCLINEEAK